jgi:hypothetical protein
LSNLQEPNAKLPSLGAAYFVSADSADGDIDTLVSLAESGDWIELARNGFEAHANTDAEAAALAADIAAYQSARQAAEDYERFAELEGRTAANRARRVQRTTG